MPTSASRVRPPAAGSIERDEAGDHSCVAQPAHAVGGGVRAQAHGGPELAPGQPPVRAEQPEDLAVDRVQGHGSRGSCAGRRLRVPQSRRYPDGNTHALTIGFGLGFLVALQLGPMSLFRICSTLRNGLVGGLGHRRAGLRSWMPLMRLPASLGAASLLSIDALRTARRCSARPSCSRSGRARCGTPSSCRCWARRPTEDVISPRCAFANCLLAATASNPAHDLELSWAAIFAAASGG